MTEAGGTGSAPGASAPAEKAQVARDTAWNFIAAAATAVCSGLRSLLLPKLLPSVDAFGVFTVLNLFKTYSPYVNAGVLMGYGVEVPRRRGQGNHAETDILAGTAHAFSFLATLGFALVMLALIPFTAEPDMRAGLGVFAVVVVLQNQLMFYSDRLRVELQFKLRSQQDMVNALGFTALAVGFAAWFGLYAVFAGLVFGQALALWWTRRHDPYRPGWRIELAALKTLIRLGIPVTLTTVLGTVIFDVDIILIKQWYPGYRMAGLYGLGVTFSALMMMVPYTVGHALAPRIYREAGKPEGERDLARYIRKPLLLLTGLAAVGSGAATLIFVPAIELYLPRYLDGLPAMRLLVWYTVFNAAVTTVGYLFAGCKSFARIIALQLTVIAANLCLNLTLLELGCGLVGVAAVTVLSYALYAAGGLWLGLRLCRMATGEMLVIMAAVFLTGFYCMAASALAELPFAAVHPLWRLGALPLYALLLLPLLALAQRRYGLLTELAGLARGMLLRGSDAPAS